MKSCRRFMFLFVIVGTVLSLFSVSAATYTPLETNLTTPYAYVVNLDTGAVLYEKNSEERVSIASTTKIMTALLVIESVQDLSQVVTVDPEAIQLVPANSSLAYLVAGEQLSYDALLSCLMVRSGNDAANALAFAVGGSYEAFIKMMNDKAAELGMTNTHYVNPHGFDEEGHYSSAKDLATLTAYALQNETFRKYFTMQSVEIPATNMMSARSFSSTCPNYSQASTAYTPLVVGAKTGYTDSAGRCLVAYLKCGEGNYVSVLLGCPTGYIENTTYSAYETKVLAGLINSSYSVHSFGDTTTQISTAPVKNMEGGNETQLYQHQVVYGLFDAGADVSGVTSSIQGISTLEAPAAAGTADGTISYYLGDELIGTSGLVTTQPIAQSMVKTIANNILTFLSYTWYIFTAILFLIFLYLGELHRKVPKQKKKRTA